MSGGCGSCAAAKARAKAAQEAAKNRNQAPAADGRFVLTAGGVQETFGSRLEAEAARARKGDGVITVKV